MKEWNTGEGDAAPSPLFWFSATFQRRAFPSLVAKRGGLLLESRKFSQMGEHQFGRIGDSEGFASE